MLLSVLVPSKYPEKLQAFLESATRTDVSDEVEFLIVIDKGSPRNYPTNKVLRFIEAEPGQTISELMEIAFVNSIGDWVLLCNDDVVVETKGWFQELALKLKDLDTLYYLNDKLFGETLCCFPVVARETLKKIGFFPIPYKRYKVDDTLFNIFHKKVYLEQIVFRHTNDHAEVGFKFPDGRIYGVEPIAAKYDQDLWAEQVANRYRMRRIINGDAAPRVMIGVSTGEFARQAKFYDHFNLLQKPADCGITLVHGQSPAKSRNIIIDQALDNDFSHILFVDDDVLLQGDALMKLLNRNVDSVSGLYTARNYPHRAFVFNAFDHRGWANYQELDPEQTGLIPIVAAGFGCYLVKTSVFVGMERPYVRLGELESDMWCDDIGFFHRLHKSGVKSYADLDVRCGHMATVTLWPNYVNGQWFTVMDTQGTETASVPQLFTVKNAVTA